MVVENKIEIGLGNLTKDDLAVLKYIYEHLTLGDLRDGVVVLDVPAMRESLGIGLWLIQGAIDRLRSNPVHWRKTVEKDGMIYDYAGEFFPLAGRGYIVHADKRCYKNDDGELSVCSDKIPIVVLLPPTVCRILKDLYGTIDIIKVLTMQAEADIDGRVGQASIGSVSYDKN